MGELKWIVALIECHEQAVVHKRPTAQGQDFIK